MSDYLRPFAEGIAHLSTREIADRAHANPRTVENWRQRANGPSWKQVVAMLADPVMRPIVLRAAEEASEEFNTARHAEVKELGT